MASREWRDINELWLEQYLEEAGLEPLWADDSEGAEVYEDHPFGWQVSCMLSDAQWSRLRSAWKHSIEQGPGAAFMPQEDHNPTEKLRAAFRCIEKLTEQNKAMTRELETLRRQR